MKSELLQIISSHPTLPISTEINSEKTFSEWYGNFKANMLSVTQSLEASNTLKKDWNRDFRVIDSTKSRWTKTGSLIGSLGSAILYHLDGVSLDDPRVIGFCVGI